MFYYRKLFMTKKKYLSIFLEKIKNKWSPAEGLLLLLEGGSFSDEVIGQFILVIRKSIQCSKNEKFRKNMQKKINSLDKIYQQEQQENWDTESLLDAIENVGN